jgi:RNA polymerase sigma-70 factor (ECF subfamily)
MGKNNSSNDTVSKQDLFEEEASPHFDSLYYMALHLTKDPSEAKDLVQDTLLRAYRFFDKYEKGTNFKAWVFTILRNLFINKYRKKKREPTKIDIEKIKWLLKDEENHNQDFNIITSKDDFSFKEYIDYFDDEVVSALKELPVDFIMPVILADIEGLPYKEIAEIMDIPLGTVRSRIFRARAFIRDRLSEYAEEMGYK